MRRASQGSFSCINWFATWYSQKQDTMHFFLEWLCTLPFWQFYPYQCNHLLTWNTSWINWHLSLALKIWRVFWAFSSHLVWSIISKLCQILWLELHYTKLSPNLLFEVKILGRILINYIFNLSVWQMEPHLSPSVCFSSLDRKYHLKQWRLPYIFGPEGKGKDF